MAEFVSEIVGDGGSYFKVEAEGLKRPPCFLRFLAEITPEDGKRFWLIETIKKIYLKNPEWIQCFDAVKKLTLMNRAKYVDLMRDYTDEGMVTHQEGVPTFGAFSFRSVGTLNREVERETSAANRKRKLMEQMKTLAESNNWLQSKYDMLVEDPEILHKWNVVREGATLIKKMNEKEKQLKWVHEQKLKLWQGQLLGEIDNLRSDDRKVIWVMDTKGGSGKTWFTRYMYHLDPEGTAWLQNGKTHDLIKALVDQAYGLKQVFFDLCRSNEDRINWDVIERVKNGMIMSTKYEVETTIIDSPTVVCFANFEPELKKLSLDRWVVFEIIDGGLYSRAVVGSDEDPRLGERKACNPPLDDVMAAIGAKLEQPPKKKAKPNAFDHLMGKPAQKVTPPNPFAVECPHKKKFFCSDCGILSKQSINLKEWIKDGAFVPRQCEHGNYSDTCHDTKCRDQCYRARQLYHK